MAQQPKYVDPVEDLLSGGVRGEVAGCPTGLSGLHPPALPADPVAAPPPPPPAPALNLEKLEGRQETGRDAEDEDVPASP